MALKYIPKDTSIVFEEIPDEITLAVNISNCQNNCIGCHSAYLKQNIGEELTEKVIDELIKKNEGITCFCFMGEGNDPKTLENRILYIKEKYPNIKIGLYSGREDITDRFFWENLDYLKLGPYKEEFGPLNNPKTNQALYQRDPNCICIIGPHWSGHFESGWKTITRKFWKND